MEFISHYGLFIAKFATVITFFIILILGITLVLASKSKEKEKGKLRIRNMNDKYLEMQRTLQEGFLSEKELKKIRKQDDKSSKKLKQEGNKQRKIFVIHFHGDIKASQVDELREAVTAILLVASPDDEVLVKLESPGGVVYGYGLAASQLKRFRENNIPLTIAIDKVAASGGYMMACVANKIIAAPFAIIGSIGVLMQLPNFHRFLKHHHIDFEQLSAGEYKRTLSVFGENTKKGREKTQEELEAIHDIFKEFIHENRPSLAIDQVATGEHWLGYKASELGLIDDIMTSDDYLMSKHHDRHILEVQFEQKKSFSQKLTKTSAELFGAFYSH
jgi:serine protease SohB